MPTGSPSSARLRAGWASAVPEGLDQAWGSPRQSFPMELVPTHGCTWVSVLRETDTDGQASGGSDSGDWIFTIREKDPKSLENGALQPSDLERNKVRLRVRRD